MDKNISKAQFKSIQFPSKDHLLITADLYEATPSRGFILLCHQSHSNRGEYRETAPKFQDWGYSALAIDQRSGMNMFGVVNETSTRAKEKGLPTGYLDAIPDIESAVDFAFQRNNDQPVIIFGSSYSAAISLFTALYNEKIKAIIAFSPGEFLKGITLSSKLQNLGKPVFVTCAKKEIEKVQLFLRQMSPDYLTFFKPDIEGFYGSQALWSSTKGSETYWNALKNFLDLLQTNANGQKG